jgi:hypothetical protein
MGEASEIGASMVWRTDLELRCGGEAWRIRSLVGDTIIYGPSTPIKD